MIGVATDLRAPGDLDLVSLDIANAENGVVQVPVEWEITGDRSRPFNLPGSFGVVTDGEGIQIEATLTGSKNGQTVVTRRAVLGLVEGETLFYRMGLAFACVDKLDCPPDTECIEGSCGNALVETVQLPEFSDELVTSVSCSSRVVYTDTASGAPLPSTSDAGQCPPELCIEGTCLKPPSPNTEPRMVTGSVVETYIHHGTATPQPWDLSTSEIEALIPTGPGMYDQIPAVIGADGTFSIPNVPQGLYYLRWDNTYFVGSTSRWDLGFVSLGRADATPVPAGTSLTLNLGNLDAWGTSGSVIEVGSAGVDTWWFNPERTLTVPDGATSLVNYTLTQADISYGGSLIEGDDLTVLELSRRMTDDGVTYDSVSRFFSLESFTQVPGANTPVNSAFSAVTSTAIDIEVRQSLVDTLVGWDGSHATAINPEASPDGAAGSLVAIRGQPGGSAYGRFDAATSFLFVRSSAGDDHAFHGLQLATPTTPTETFSVFYDLTSDWVVPIRLPGTTTGPNLSVSLQSNLLFDRQNGPLEPILGPPTNPTIGGRSLFSPQDGVGLTPTIAWTPPAVGAASMYVVSIREVFAVGTETRFAARSTVIETAETSFEIPPAALMPGRHYVALIHSTNVPSATAPFRNAFPEAHATIVTSIFSP